VGIVAFRSGAIASEARQAVISAPRQRRRSRRR
jgi:hypothetical protein